jgi:hypothetical protein
MASKAKAKEKIKRSIDRDLVETFMEGEAVESDEEIIFGFDTKNGDDDEDMEEQAGEDGHVKDLVDDQEMDEAVVAKELVLEKVQCVDMHSHFICLEEWSLIYPPCHQGTRRRR